MPPSPPVSLPPRSSPLTTSRPQVLGLVLNAYDLKVGGEALKTMNIAMGLGTYLLLLTSPSHYRENAKTDHFHTDPKSQSISHRLGAARKKAASLIANGPAFFKPGTPTKPALPLTPRGPKLGGGGGGGGSSRRSTTSKRSGTATKGKKFIKDESDTDLDLDDQELGTPTPLKRERLRKSVKRSYEESGSDEDESDDSEQSAYDGDRGRGRGGGGGGGGAKKRARAEAEKGEEGDGDGDPRAAYGTVITSYFEGDSEISETEADSLPQVEEV